MILLCAVTALFKCILIYVFDLDYPDAKLQKHVHVWLSMPFCKGSLMYIHYPKWYNKVHFLGLALNDLLFECFTASK